MQLTSCSQAGMALPIFRNSVVLRPDCRGVGASLLHRRCLLRSAVILGAKGFGNIDKASSSDDESSQPRTKKKRLRQIMPTVPTVAQSTSLRNVEELEQQLQKKKEDEEFSKRLAVIRAEGEQRARNSSPSGTPAADVLDSSPFASTSASANGTSSPTATPTPSSSSIYDNPPSLTDTLRAQFDSELSDPKLRSANLGPGALPLAAGAVFFSLVFVLVSGGDMNMGRRNSGPRPAQAPPDPIEERMLKTRAAELEEELKQRADDPAVLEPLALTYAKLFKFDDAADRIDRLLAQRPNDVDAWRILGESSLLADQPARSAAAYEKAAQLSAAALRSSGGAPSLQILTGLVDAYSADGKQAVAEKYLDGLLGRLGTTVPPGGSSSASLTAAADPVGARLLLGKLYSGWRGHDGDAAAVYEKLVELFPEDYRGYLARGVYLKSQGRRADADRMFLQAKFYAPENRKGLVSSMASSNPVLDVQDNN